MSANNDPIALSKPPQDCLYPLHVLNRYLASLEKEQTANDAAARPKRQDEILQTVDFLYGSALDGALAVLESSGSDGGSGTGYCTTTSHNVTRLQSPRRALYTVASSSTKSSMRGGPRAAGPSSWSQSQDSCYICMIPENNNNNNNNNEDNNANGNPDEDSSGEIYYCSCRSFLEKSRNSGSVVSLCKHLLALKLMPVLGLTCTTVQLPSEEEFSRALLQRVSPY